jgi:hypothetical protein
VGGKAVGSAVEFSKAIAEVRKGDKQHAVLLVRRGDSTSFVALRVKD